MRKLLISTSVALSILPAAFSAHAAETATLAVKGTIATSTCNVSLSDATIDLGNISKSDLTAELNTFTPAAITLGLDCDAASSVALQVTDNRASSAIAVSDLPEGAVTNTTDTQLFGLGKDSASNNIGTVMYMLSDATVDSASGSLLESTDKSTWSNGANTLTKDTYLSVAKNSTATEPASFTTASFTITPYIGLFSASAYPSGENTTIDGSVTFTVNYL